MKENNNDFNIPLISENLEEIEYQHRNKYRNLYIRLVERCKTMTEEELSGYNEVHHILPRCMGGKDNEENLILMPIRYHIMAHIILSEIFPDNVKIVYAAFCMINLRNKSSRKRNKIILKELRFSTRFLAQLREKTSELSKGENNPMYGRRGKLSPNYGKPLSESRKQKISNTLKGRKLPEEVKKKISEALKGEKAVNYGKTFSEETKRKISLHHADFSGGKNGRAIKVISPEGKIYDCIKEAAKEINVDQQTLSKWIKGQTKDNHGWSFYKEETNISESD